MSKELNDCYKKYTARMTEIYLYQAAAKSESQKELDKLNKHRENIKINPERERYFRSMHHMAFQSAMNGEIVQFGYNVHSIEDWIQAVYLRKNKQYQWLLAEAYEYFEDAVEDAYAFLGFKDNNAWPLKDFGEITVSEVNIKPFSWFQKQAGRKRIEKHLSYFRKKFTEIEDLEINNALRINLKFSLIVVMKLRHIIVHNGGWVDDKEEFVKSVFKQAEILNNDRIDEVKKQLVESFFGVGEKANMVHLVENPVNIGFSGNAHIDRFKNILLTSMMAYIEILYVVLMKNLWAFTGEQADAKKFS